jgi:hypothetical protein
MEIMQGIADVLDNPPLRTYTTTDPVFLTCISVAHLTRHLKPATRHIITIFEHGDPTHIAVIRSIHPVWNRASSNMSMATLTPFDPESAYNVPRTLFKLFDITARKIQLTCLRCKRTYTSESNCRACLRSHRFKCDPYPSLGDLMGIWDSMPSEQRLALCRACPPTLHAIETRARLAQIDSTKCGIILRMARGDTMTINSISGRTLVQALNTFLEGGVHRVQHWNMHDFEGTYESGDFYAYIATLITKNLFMTARFVRDTIKIKDSQNAETELRESEEKRHALEAKKAKKALKKKSKAMAKYIKKIDAENSDINVQHPIYAQLASPCRFLSGMARCLLESVDGDASKLIIYDPVPRQPGGFDPVAAEKNLRRRAAMGDAYVVEI